MQILSTLQQKIESINNEVWDDPYASWFAYTELSKHIQLTFFGEGYDDDPNQKLQDVDIEDNYSFIAFLETLATISAKVSHLNFSGPDKGANGFRNWDFTRLVNSKCSFSELKSLKVALTDPGDHNMSCVSDILNDYDENGMIAKLVASMPNLEDLVLPSAPDDNFFNLRLRKLHHLRIESGYSSQDFIGNFADSQGFENLTALDFSDVSFIADLEERNQMATSFESYQKLFKSKAFDSVVHCKLRNTILKREELSELKRIRPELQLLVMSAFSGRYVSHH